MRGSIKKKIENEEGHMTLDALECKREIQKSRGLCYCSYKQRER